MAARVRHDAGRFLLIVAGVAGGVHAAFSLYWAFGGDWLLDTVGQGAVDLRRAHPVGAAVLLLAVTAVKVGGVGLPIAAERVPGFPLRRPIRFLGWVGGGFLVLYGTGYAVVSGCVLNGLITVSGEVDRRGLVGHAYLWDPLFACWGAALVAGLWATRSRPAVSPAPPPAPRR